MTSRAAEKCGCCDSDVALVPRQDEPVEPESDQDVPGFDNWEIFDVSQDQTA
jgi:hypothetical protein